jgi:dolichol-phosphate mannosyltransferase
MSDLKPQVSVIVPTRDEADCIEPLVDRLVAALGTVQAEIIFADDSSDHTPSIIEKVADTATIPIVCLHRSPDERVGGLGGAVVAGLRIASGELVVVMDGDLQHPPECVPALIEALNSQQADLIVASRYSDGGKASGLSNQTRRTVSRAVTRLARVMFPRRLRLVSDPMSGFFSMRIAAVEVDRLRPIGYKILLEVLLRNRMRVGEIGFDFAPRYGGASKANFHEGMRFLAHILRLRVATVLRYRRRVGPLQVAHA